MYIVGGVTGEFINASITSHIPSRVSINEIEISLRGVAFSVEGISLARTLFFLDPMIVYEFTLPSVLVCPYRTSRFLYTYGQWFSLLLPTNT